MRSSSSKKIIDKKNENMSSVPIPVYFKLPNATCGKNYSSGFEISLEFYSDKTMDTTQNDIKILSIKGLETVDLTYNPDRGLICGVPVKSGEITLEILFKLKHTGKTHKTRCLFIVNPDPKSLWKNKPSDQNDLFWKKDEEAQELMTDNGWTLIGASKRGRSHAHEGKCRDDHFFISTDSFTKWNILAVADGAGSATLSREGARIAVMESSRILSEKLKEYDSEIITLLLDDNCADAKKGVEHENPTDGLEENKEKRLKDILYNIFSLAVYEPVKVIHDTVKQQQPDHGDLNFRDFHTTLLLAVHKEINGRQFIASYWIGDGGIAVYSEGKSVTILGEGDSGEFAGQTRFLDNSAIDKDDIYKRICFEYQESITALILMTDGITDPFFETDQNLNRLESWDNLWKKILKKQFSDKPGKTEQNLLEWLDFWSPGNHDDRSVVLLFQKEKRSNE